MSAENLDHEKILAQINQEFSAYRQKRVGRQRYPSILKDLVKSASKAGIKQARVATAAGVPRITIREWTGCKKAKPRELKIIEDHAPMVTEPAAASLARICFRSGVFIELPASALRADLLKALNGGVQ